MRIMLSILALSAFGLMNQVNAAEVEVKWNDPKKFIDIEAISDRQERFEQRVMENLSAYFAEQGATLPAANKLHIQVLDLDIAGRVEPTFGRVGMRVQRILDDISYPMIKFTYSYQNAEGEELQAGEERLKDLGQLTSRRTIQKSSRDSLYFEKELIKKWFKETFEE